MTEPCDLSIVDAAAQISSGDLSPLELTRSCLARLEREERNVAAFAHIDAERALEVAKVLTDELTTSGPRGALHGIPLGIKDVIDVSGMPTRAGSDVLGDEPSASEDAPVIRDLSEAGAVVLGKTTTHEFAFGCETPPTRNPWDLGRSPGGSSGGSGAALAAGECLGALGTDSGGSVRIPAALCGVNGLRPRMGSVSLGGTVPFSWTHDTIGPLARSAADLAILWSAMTRQAPITAKHPSRVRVGSPADLSALGDMDPDVEAAVQAAVGVLVDAGATRVDVDIARYSDWDADRFVAVLSDFLAAHIDAGWYPERVDRYGPELRDYLKKAEQLRGADLVLARRRLDRRAARFHAALSDVDVLALPTAALVAPLVDDSAEDDPGVVGVSPVTVRLIRTCAPISYCGLSAVSVPCGLSQAGLPIGLQLVGRDEGAVISVAMAFQQRTDHHLLRPGKHVDR